MVNDIRKIIGKRLKELREEKGLSFKTLEKEIGISGSALCRIENEKVDAKGFQIVRLAEYFGVTTDYLLGREN